MWVLIFEYPGLLEISLRVSTCRSSIPWFSIYVYSEEEFKEALENCESGFLLIGERLNNIRYAESTVSFQQLIDRVNDKSERYSIEVNINKTKFMVKSKEKKENCQNLINYFPVERVPKFEYLGVLIHEQKNLWQ
jgi:hypothetical protein